ncbi:MAG: TRAP transporter small permease [Candidatus Pacebacteria bacterium]|nr:TRAP transporter small permease [Candidatus Paceibacterota bacterium]
MADNLLRVVRALLAIIRGTAGTLLICSVTLNFANIFGRYFIHSSISWAEEAMLFLMIGCVFLGSSIVAWSDRHIRMDIVYRLMPENIRIILDLFSELVFLLTAIVLVVFSWPVIRQLVAFDQRSLAANIPLAIPQAMIPIGLLIMAFMVVAHFFTGRSRH